MRIKELKRTVNVSWSPAEQYPVLLAAGSAAQQVDASFSTSSNLELYSLNLDDPGFDLELKSSLQTQHKFQKLVWSGAGVIIGGCDGGILQFYGVDKLLKNSPDALISTSTKHNGDVSALDVNPYQKNLVASGASESEIFIWDLNNTSQPMAPGNRSQPHEQVQALAWNYQVQHILGSTFASRCVVWDLRKNEPIMKLSDSQPRSRWRALAWHPAVATQLCVASEDDAAPHIQLWDLRLASSPLATFEGHEKGVLALSWSRHDPDLLVSAGRDGRLLCWNPNNTKPGGELLCELSRQEQWMFDVSWSPRTPGVLVSASCDQHVAVHALLAGTTHTDHSVSSASNIMDSFGGAQLGALPAVSRAPQPAQPRAHFPKAPRWLKRPTRAKFAFGGKLVTFEQCPLEAGSQKVVYISQVVSEPEIVERAAELDAVLGTSFSDDPAAADTLAQYCLSRGDSAKEQDERYTWFYLRANFLPTFRTEALNLLGYKQDEIPSKFKAAGFEGGDNLQANDVAGLSRGESTETDAELSTDTSTDLSDTHTLIERKLANLDLEPSVNNVVIPNGEDSTSMICRALVCGNLEEAVELCLSADRTADALVIASLGSEELVYKVQKYHLNATAQEPVSLVAGAMLQSRWDTLVRSAASRSWRQTLAALLTHCDGETLAHYCEMLGDKLSSESDPSLSEGATICYLCAMSPDALVTRWARARSHSVADLSALTELALLARRAAAARGRNIQSCERLESVLREYAMRLAAQGCLQSALHALRGVARGELVDRLTLALGQGRNTQTQPQQSQPASRTRTYHAAHLEPNKAYAHAGSAFTPNPWTQAPVVAPPAPQTPLPPGPPGPPAHPVQPQRPPSAGPHVAGGITSKSKYKVDPSVKGAPLYNNYNFNNPAPPHSYGAYGGPAPDHYGNPSVPNTGYGAANQPINPNVINPINPNLMNPINPMNPVNPVNSMAPLNPITPLNPTNAPLPNSGVVNGGYYNHQAPVEPATAAVAPPPRSSAPGWNDPPMMTSKSKPKQDVQTQAPITHPLFGVELPQHVPLAPAGPGQYPGQQYPGQQHQGQQYPGQQLPGQQYQGQQLPAQQYQGQQFPGQQFPEPQQFQGQYVPQAPQAYPQQPASPVPPRVPTPVQKPPLPDQYLVLQTVLDSLRSGCAERAANPQMKRKLEDVQRRLETLYDMLRENRLSESAVSALQSCVQYAQSGEHGGALQVATSLATGQDFAAAASFLPGLKTLFQLAAQLQVLPR